jgi:polar amino acid transport system substrate-binding protein
MRALLLLFLILLAGPVKAADPVLAPSGTLRAAYIATNVAQARLDPATGTVSGVIADIARELALRANVLVTIMPVPTAAAVIETVRSGAADIGFVAPNPERTGLVLYSQTYMLVQQSALVRSDSPLHSVNELDRPGQVIGINTDDSVGVWLQQHLTAARARLHAARCRPVAQKRGGHSFCGW